MNLFTLAGIVGILVILFGVVMAAISVVLSRAVVENELAMEQEKTSVNPALTLGFEIPVDADVPDQIAAARRLAAMQAAALPRGANMRIGRLGAETTEGAGDAVEQDPLTAVKIAAFHTWQGAKVGPPPVSGVEETPVARQAAAAPSKKPEDLVPGKDFPFIEITDGMSPDEVRRARIANARARSAAVKALKQQAAGGAPVPQEGAPAGEPVVAQAQKAAPTAAAAAATGIAEPQYIDITDDMSPDEVRKARIANARARSAYMKALKAAGVDPSQKTERAEQPAAAPAATAESAQAATVAEPTPATGREAVAVPADVGQPDYIEITDDMSPDEVRKARVANARERSRFYKALKDRGIDPKEWEAQQEQGAPAPSQVKAAEVAAKAEAQQEEAAAAPAEAQAEPEVAAAASASGGTVQIPSNIPRPDYIEITDDMPADEVRRARVHNARERSAFYKALKAAGIDPKEVAESQ